MFFSFNQPISLRTILHATFHHLLLCHSICNDDDNSSSIRSLLTPHSHLHIGMIHASGLFGYVGLTQTRVFSRSRAPFFLPAPSSSSRTRISQTHAAAGNPSPSDLEAPHHTPALVYPLSYSGPVMLFDLYTLLPSSPDIHPPLAFLHRHSLAQDILY